MFHTLISKSWFQSNLKTHNLKPLDCSWYMPSLNHPVQQEFVQNRLVGAQLFDIDEVCRQSPMLLTFLRLRTRLLLCPTWYQLPRLFNIRSGRWESLRITTSFATILQDSTWLQLVSGGCLGYIADRILSKQKVIWSRESVCSSWGVYSIRFSGSREGIWPTRASPTSKNCG